MITERVSKIFPKCILVGPDSISDKNRANLREHIELFRGYSEGFSYLIGYMVHSSEYFVQWYYDSRIAHTSLTPQDTYILFQPIGINLVILINSDIRGNRLLAKYLAEVAYTEVFNFADDNITVKFAQSSLNRNQYKITYKDSAWLTPCTFLTSSEPKEIARLMYVLEDRKIPENIGQDVYDGKYVPSFVQFTHSIAILMFLNWID